MMKKWFCSRRNQILIFLAVIAVCVMYYASLNSSMIEQDLDLTRRSLSLTEKPVQNSSAASKNAFNTVQNIRTASKTSQNDGTAPKTPENSSTDSKTALNSGTDSKTALNNGTDSKTARNSGTQSKTARNSGTQSKTARNSDTDSKTARNSSSSTKAAQISSTSVDITKRKSIIEYIENRLQEALKEDKGTGCEIPHLDPFAKEVTQFDKDLPTVVCNGRDWVKCYLHECRVTKEILATTSDVKCAYRDIIHISDAKHTIGAPRSVLGGDPYILEKSDFVTIVCTGTHINDSLSSESNIFHTKWMGYGAGHRTGSARAPHGGPGGPIDVLIFGFDSTSKNGFIRRMPNSYKYITEELGATVLNGYNIVGDGTPAALFPILTGKTELELPDVRKSQNKGTLDDMPFIFEKLKKRGFHTAYYEDMPDIGTFQYRFNGFKRQPADHYLRSFFLEEATHRWYSSKPGPYCVGDTPRHELMMNLTEQFFKLPGSHFAFTFVADITHNDFNMISTADHATVRFLQTLKDGGHLERTVLFVMGDHGPRYANVRDTLQGKLEERLPLMAIRLPRALTDKRPNILANLVLNADALTTPHDIHATVLDALDMRQHWNPYAIQGADLKRGLTLFEPISRNRSCSEAGIEPHWCACLMWEHVSSDRPIHGQVAHAFVNYINSLTKPFRSLCAPRTLTSIAWVMVQRANNRLLAFKGARDQDGYVGAFNAVTKRTKENYQIKVAVSPGYGVYEASATYFIEEDKFVFDERDISRVNAYNDEPSCISAAHPHLNKYCYCKDRDAI